MQLKFDPDLRQGTAIKGPKMTFVAVLSVYPFCFSDLCSAMETAVPCTALQRLKAFC